MPLSSEIKLESLFCVNELIPLLLTTWFVFLNVTDIQIRFRRVTYEKQIYSCQFQGRHELLRKKRMHFRKLFTLTSKNKIVRNFMIPLHLTSNHSHSLPRIYYLLPLISNTMSLASLKFVMLQVGYPACQL